MACTLQPRRRFQTMFLCNFYKQKYWKARVQTSQPQHTYRFRNQLWENVFLIMFWDSRDNGCQWRLGAQTVLFRYLTPQFVQIDILLGLRGVSLGFIFLDKRVGNIRASSHISFVLGGQLCVLLGFVQLLGGQRSHGLCRHNGDMP